MILQKDIERAQKAQKRRSFLSHLIPNNHLKDCLRQFYYKHFYYDFKIKQEKDFHVIKNYFDFTFEMKFYYERGLKYPLCRNPYGDLQNGIKGYLKYYIPKEGDIVIDGGAYVGQFTVLASNLVGKRGKVISLEPDPKNYEKLIQNIKLSDLNNVVALNIGLWDAEGMLSFQQDNHGSYIGKMKKERVLNTEIKVKVMTIDQIIEEYSLNNVNFIKMDIEGAEFEAVKGASTCLNDFRPNIAIASYHLRDNEPTWKKLEPILLNMGHNTKTEFAGQITTYVINDYEKN